jgi:hypothetical protein
MNPAELGFGLGDAPRFAVGLALFLLPGLAAADRLLQGPRRWLMAPVLSFTLVPVAGILLHFAAGWHTNVASTTLLCLALAALFASRRLAQMLDPDSSRTPTPVPHRDARPRWQAAALLGLVLFVALAHGVAHLPGPQATPVTALPALAMRLAGDVDPYPVHVDEYTHMAYAAHATRNGSLADPYTGERFDVGIFSLQGDVHERGFQLGLAQLSLLTGVSLPLFFLWGAAVWAGLLAALVWAALRGPGAWAAAAFVAFLPTDTLFMGPGLLVPITFGLAWVVAVAWAMQQANGGARVVAVLLLVTGSFFIHIVAGAACLVMAVCAAWGLDASWRTRAALSAVAFVPLVWVGPAIVDEVAKQWSLPANHTLGQSFFGAIGLVAWILFVAGTAAAVTSKTHRAWGWFAIVAALVVAVALVTGTTSLALYYRSAHLLMLTAAILGGYAVGRAFDILKRLVPPPAAVAAMVVGVAIAVSPGIASHLHQPYYRVHDDATWRSAEVLAMEATASDVFLSDPWQAMAYNAVSGAAPYTVLRPGSPPERGDDWSFYLATGASEAWLKARGITYVIAPVPPNAPYTHLGSGVYRL